ncbi:hypothetical protein SHLO109777_07905 [Shewanella loihica]|uniref:Uncharacterized protein n=1 Tax=Shewanella loihica (strain ATCC BAA-1088 / PV-4) TaxID=323850 RepID=A3QHX8_SHELP|nr:hypothetical protein [Shewanella loihica]ABO25076.1 hypothetical protein Shew_3210 [Shewanella loihica PV-4]
MEFVGRLGGWEPLLCYLLAGFIFILLLWGLSRLIGWAKGMPAGAYLALALFPLISLFPIRQVRSRNYSVSNKKRLNGNRSLATRLAMIRPRVLCN